jgi:hypothetical protein
LGQVWYLRLQFCNIHNSPQPIYDANLFDCLGLEQVIWWGTACAEHSARVLPSRRLGGGGDAVCWGFTMRSETRRDFIRTLGRSTVGLSLAMYTVPRADAAGTTYYVDASRPDDSGAGTSWASAKKTIQAGVNLLSSGDTLKVKSGTYAEGVSLNGKSFTNWVTIETDDGAGNPGTVTISGGSAPYNYLSVTGWSPFWIRNTNYVRLDGRRRGGFRFPLTTAHALGLVFNSPSDTGAHLKVLNCQVTGTISAGGVDADNAAIQTYGYSDVEIGYCDVNLTGSLFLIQVMSASAESDPNRCSSGSIHHCEVQGQTSSGYSAISLLRFDGCHVYANYLHNMYSTSPDAQGPTIIRCRQAHDNRVYNNVISVDSGRSARNFFQARGMSTGTGAANRNWFFNNTCAIDGTLAESVFFISDLSSANACFNNLVVGGGIPRFCDTWSPVEAGSGNAVYNNVVTGSVASWFASGLSATFSTTSPNYSSQGTAFLALSGAKPAQYWALTASRDGVGTTPGTDYNGGVRSTPVDVGAFEFGSVPGSSVTGPSAPKNVVIR